MDSELKSPYKISLDFYIRKIITVNAKQLDSNSRVINITCTENGKKIILDSSTTSAFVRYKKSDGNEVLNEVSILDDGTVNLELSQQMLAVEGRQTVDIMLINGTELATETVENILSSVSIDGISVLSTMSFCINTEGCAIEGSKIESSYEYNALIEGLGKMVAVDQRMSILEKTINTNENQRQINENTRINAENTRINAEDVREVQETKRIETFNTNETSRQSTFKINENNRQDVFDSNEEERLLIFNNKEIERKNTFNDSMTTWESEIQNITTEFKDAENLRVKAENDRDIAENTRVETENSRVIAEIERETSTANAISQCETATTNANTATERANVAAESCENIANHSGIIMQDEKGSVNGVATLDDNAKITREQLNFDLIYPVGSIYMSVNNTKPSVLFGGTWEQIKDRFLLSAGDIYIGGSTGGEATHTLSKDEMPIHEHGFLDYWGTTYDSSATQGTRNCVAINGDGSGLDSSSGANARTKTAEAGGGQAHNNMPPYLTVYMWQRIA